jgi:3-phenylpropionate/trans-cinnamate dioxygenase ferredoxin reductase component
VDDAARLRPRLTPGARVVVVGAGFIGCELAATARQLGCEVTVVEPLPVPMLRPLGTHLARAIQAHHEDLGVRFHLGRVVTTLHSDSEGRIRAVELDDGVRLGCDVLVESIGSHPNVEWLEGNGLDLSDGVLCDELMRVEGRPDVVAVGDVARHPCGFLDGAPLRIEHWCVPTDTARRAAPALVSHLTGAALAPPRAAPLPSFWSDQFELRVQGLGVPGAGDRHAVLEGTLARLDAGVAVGATRQDRLVGVVTVALPPTALRRYRALLTEPAADAATALSAA